MKSPSMMLAFIGISLSANVSSQITQSTSPPPKFRVVDLSNLVPSFQRGIWGNEAVAINNKGHTVILGYAGRMSNGEAKHVSSLYDGIAVTAILGSCAAQTECSTAVVDLNDNDSFITHDGYVYRNEKWKKIPDWGFGVIPSAINNSGQVVGVGNKYVTDYYYPTAPRAFIANRSNLIDLGSVYGGGNQHGGYSSGRAVNRYGHVAGSSEVLDDETCYNWGDAWKAAVFTYSTVYNITLIGNCYSDATDINDRGDVVGSNNFQGTSTSDFYPFIYSKGILRKIGTLPGVAQKINNTRTVIGNAVNGSNFIWNRKFGYYDILQLIEPASHDWSRIRLLDINDAGIIVGGGYKGSSAYEYPVLLIPTDMPANWIAQQRVLRASSVQQSSSGSDRR